MTALLDQPLTRGRYVVELAGLTDPFGNPLLTVTRNFGVLPGDANGDGRVDILDFLTLRSNFGAASSDGALVGDFDGDGNVSILDFLVLRANFGDDLFA